MTAKKQRAVVTSRRGRPTAYRPEYAEQVRKLSLLGSTDAEMADFFGVSEVTINAWKKRYPDFLKSMRAGKLIADAEVAEKFYQRACGYSHPAVKILQYQGRPIEVVYTEHYSPDTHAASLWLRNRQPRKWRDVEKTEDDAKDTLTQAERDAIARQELLDYYGAVVDLDEPDEREEPEG
jgi:hypothetical protein